MPSPDDRRRTPDLVGPGSARDLVGPVAILARIRSASRRWCGHQRAHDEDEQHGVEWTVWQDGVELFVAHPHAIAGEPFDVVLHATEEQTGKPLSSGSVALTIAGNGQVFEGGPVEAGDSGVWAVAVELSTAGKYDMRLAIDSPQVPAGRLAFEGASLTVHESEKTLESIAIADDAADASEVHFLKEQQWRIGLRTAVVRPRSIAEQLVVPGKVVAPHGSETMVFSPVPGRVTPPPDGPLPQIGEAVEAGQTLAVIEPSIAGAQSVQLLVNQRNCGPLTPSWPPGNWTSNRSSQPRADLVRESRATAFERPVCHRGRGGRKQARQTTVETAQPLSGYSDRARPTRICGA